MVMDGETVGLLEDDLWVAMELLLSPEPPRPKGGRPRIPNRQVFTGILFVLKTGIPWELCFPRRWAAAVG
jgi:transposase